MEAGQSKAQAAPGWKHAVVALQHQPTAPAGQPATKPVPQASLPILVLVLDCLHKQAGQARRRTSDSGTPLRPILRKVLYRLLRRPCSTERSTGQHSAVLEMRWQPGGDQFDSQARCSGWPAWVVQHTKPAFNGRHALTPGTAAQPATRHIPAPPPPARWPGSRCQSPSSAAAHRPAAPPARGVPCTTPEGERESDTHKGAHTQISRANCWPLAMIHLCGVQRQQAGRQVAHPSPDRSLAMLKVVASNGSTVSISCLVWQTEGQEAHMRVSVCVCVCVHVCMCGFGAARHRAATAPQWHTAATRRQLPSHSHASMHAMQQPQPTAPPPLPHPPLAEAGSAR